MGLCRADESTWGIRLPTSMKPRTTSSGDYLA